MAHKVSTVIVKIDLDCQRCYKKISKTICKLQEKMNIQSIVFDEKKNTVTLSGPFDPQKLSKKLRCEAGKVITEIIVVVEEKPSKPEIVKEKPCKSEIVVEVKVEEEKPCKPKPGCGCPCRPPYEGYYGYNRCCWCSRGYGCMPQAPPPMICDPQPAFCGAPPMICGPQPPARCAPPLMICGPQPPICGAPPMICGPKPPVCGGCNTCTFICEENPQSCSYM